MATKAPKEPNAFDLSIRGTVFSQDAVFNGANEKKKTSVSMGPEAIDPGNPNKGKGIGRMNLATQSAQRKSNRK